MTPPKMGDDDAVDLAGIILIDVRNASSVDLGAEPPLAVASIIRHRH